ncbi:MAG TPA: hypothetical protein VGO93_10545 [Candidatus Xenobia bacterium]
MNLASEIKQARQAAERYHHLLRDIYTDDFRAEFTRIMSSGWLDYGGRPLCPFMRPHFITHGQLALVNEDMEAIIVAFRRLGEQARSSPALQDAMGITPEERELIALPPGYDNPSVMSRLDTFLTDIGLQLVEYNAECPTGVGYNERLYMAFMRLDLMRRFSREYALQASDAMEDVLQALLRSYRQFGGTQQPNIAIVDWSTVVTRGEFEIFREYFEARGYATRLVDPRELTWNGKVLSAGDYRIDIVYRRVLTAEFLEKRTECQAMEEAYRAQGACFVNNFQTKLLHKKLVFAALLDEGFLGELPAGVAKTLRRCVPWTARLAEGKVPRRGETIDLLETLLAERERFVLKPNDDYGGRGISLGWQLTDPVWAAILRKALADQEVIWVVQERVHLWQEPFPDLEGHVQPRYVDLDPFIFTDYYRGFLTRLSNAAISNVTAGGGQAPTFILSPRES